MGAGLVVDTHKDMRFKSITKTDTPSKWYNVRGDDVNDDIFDNNVKKKEEYQQKMDLKVQRSKEKYQVDDHKKE